MVFIWEITMAGLHTTQARWLLRATLLVLLVVALAGCSRPKGTVTGKVSFNGEAVPSGTVSFYGKDDEVSSAPIGPDGAYEATKVPLGEVRVTVTTPPPPDPGAAEKLKKNPMIQERGITIKQEKVVSVPRKYNVPGTSGISLTVTKGSQPFDITLK
jgi:hypothetical protein